jgi:hypothetical protein
MVHEFKWEALLEVRLMPLVQYPGQCALARLPRRTLRVRGPGMKPKRSLSHPGGAGEEKTGGKRKLPGPGAASGRPGVMGGRE